MVKPKVSHANIVPMQQSHKHDDYPNTISNNLDASNKENKIRDLFKLFSSQITEAIKSMQEIMRQMLQNQPQLL